MRTRTHWIIGLMAILPCAMPCPTTTDGQKSSQSSGQAICNTQRCNEISKRISDWMDDKVEPCQDFYRYACGNYLKNDEEIPQSYDSWNPILSRSGQIIEERGRELLEMPNKETEFKTDKIVRDYYNQCTNEETIEKDGLSPAKNLMTDLGGWPVVEGDKWDAKGNAWYEVAQKINSIGISSEFIIKTIVYFDYDKNEKRVIWLDQPTLGLKRHHLVKGFGDPKVQHYYEYMVDSAEIMGADKYRAEKEMREALEFEIELAKISDPDLKRRDPKSMYHPRTVREVECSWIFPGTFKDYINDFFTSAGVTQIQFDDDEKILLLNPGNIDKIFKLVSNTSPRVIANYQAWRAFADIVPYLNKDARKLREEYYLKHKKVNVTVPRWKKCVREIGFNADIPIFPAVFSYLIPPAASLYFRSFFPKEGKKTAENMVAHIKKAFESALRSTTWMDQATKEEAVKKLRFMTITIGGPDEFYDHNVLNELYKDFRIGENYLSTAMSVLKFWKRFHFRNLRKPINKDDWFEHPYILNKKPVHNPFITSMEFPAAFLQKSIFDPEVPDYINFATFGFHIGRRISSGFDHVRRQFDYRGVLRDWWNQQTLKIFKEKTKCLIYQYGNYTVSQVGMKVNGTRTMNMNLNDNNGLNQAYLGYVNYAKENGPGQRLVNQNSAQKQLLWVSFAQLHCEKFKDETLRLSLGNPDTKKSPPEFLVRGALHNNKEFAKDFNCRKGSPMNPEKKCEIL